jgi:hypothetical protein
MPVFEWDGDGAPAIKSGFKYYWALGSDYSLDNTGSYSMGFGHVLAMEGVVWKGDKAFENSRFGK